jgi:HD superfamily phosphodiesterase
MPDMFQGESLKALYRDRLLVGAKIALKPEDTRLKRSQEIAEVAEEILDGEGGQPKVVFAATILGDLVLHSQPQGRQEVSSSQGESPRAVVKKVLADLGTEKEVIDQVCQIIEDRINGTSGEEINHRIVSDAWMVGDLLEKKKLLEERAIERLIENKVQTETGKKVARERLLTEVKP